MSYPFKKTSPLLEQLKVVIPLTSKEILIKILEARERKRIPTPPPIYAFSGKQYNRWSNR